ncbi:hypothetical protein N7457_005521 [Penicillium paradoxum]|uniref:uncharacterized protein n=1 Tax=Penicillium paradoxum TaxID=176176 RepID=UPI002549BA67|nr:uncharacterized protein N7457_005521 [Penicillium paradoxum]KAJ5780361.1 hypothetical protein N7457_005521 [Penicillium paradoxum]
MLASNQAAWLSSKSARPLKVGLAPYTNPHGNEIVVKNGAVAVNRLEWTKQLMGNMASRWMKYPFVLGNDCAGEVVQIGDDVSRFKIGDRVLAHALSMDPAVNKSSEGAFQKYTVIRDNMAALIPDWMSYEEACVVPLGLSTAASALFQKDYLALKLPDASAAPSDSTPEVVLVWGGSTSVGSNAIQLAIAAGYEVVTTCSPTNFDYVSSLGAYHVFDYHSKATIQQIVNIMRNKAVAGAIAIGKGSTEACIEILAKTNGSKFVAQASSLSFETIPTTTFGIVRAMGAWVWSRITIFIKSKLRGVKTKLIVGTSLAHNEVGASIYSQFLPGALENGGFIAAPRAFVVGKGLGDIQKAFDFHMQGVSAQKIVVSL